MARKLSGQRFGKLTVLFRSGSNRQGSISWVCKCDCGKETTLSSDHLTRKKNPVTSCGCNRNRTGKENPISGRYVGDICETWWNLHVVREIFQTRRLKISMNLTLEFAWDLFLKQNKKCALSGVELFFSKKSHENSASLDRIDSSKGYETDNVQWVHKHVNFMKRNYSQRYFIDFCTKIAKFSKKKYN